MNNYLLSAIYIYPVKSLGGISVHAAMVEDRGLQHDRRWMLVDENGMFISQRKHFELSLLELSISNDYLVVKHKTDPMLEINFGIEEHIGGLIPVTVWDDSTVGYEVSHVVSAWFSDFMRMKVRLVRMADEARRLVDTKYASDKEIVSFADGYPCLLIGQSSLDSLNEKLDTPILMDRFRPNFVFTGGEAHVEDNFGDFLLGETMFHAVKPCARCVLTTIDQQTGVRGAEPLKTLATYRKVGNKIMFGQNLIHKGNGLVRVGDELFVQTWKMAH